MGTYPKNYTFKLCRWINAIVINIEQLDFSGVKSGVWNVRHLTHKKTQTTWFDDIEGIWIENTKQSTELKNRTISAQVFTRFGSFWDFSMLCW